MESLLQTICLSTCILGFICLFIVVFHNKYRLYPKVLTVAIILSCILCIVFWAFYQGRFPLLPYANLAMLSAPIYFTPGVLLYLYVESLIGEKRKFNYWNLLHFTPAMVNICVLIPFYLRPNDVRQQLFYGTLMHEDVDLNFTIISLEFEMFATLTSWTIYVILTILMLKKFVKRNPDWLDKHQSLWLWLKSISIISAITLILYFILLLISFERQNYSLNLIIPPIFLLNASMIVSFSIPQILYGITNQRLKKQMRSLELPHTKVMSYKNLIESHIMNNQSYLRQNYTIKDLADEVKIPLHHVSYVLNQEIGENFQNYINKFRINHIINNFDNDDWANYSVDGIGYEAGFSSRNTFFKAFKSLMGTTPAEFLKKSK